MKRLLSFFAVLLLSTQVFAGGLTSLAPPRYKFTNSNNQPLGGGLVYTYQCGTSTPVTTYTDSTGLSQNTNPVVLGSDGSASIWYSGCIKVNVTDYLSVQQPGFPVDNITDIGSFVAAASQWIPTNLTPTYLTATTFSVPGNVTNAFASGTRMQLVTTGGTVYGSSLGASYGSGVTTVTVALDSGSLTGVSAVGTGILTVGNTSVPVLPVNTQTGNYTLTAADNNKTVELNSAVTATITLPAATEVPTGFKTTLKNIGAGTLAVAGTVDGVSNPTLAKYGNINIISDGTSWYFLTSLLSQQNSVASSRSLGTVYQNTTGRAMFVSIAVTNVANSGFDALTDSSNPPTTIVASVPSGSYSMKQSLFFIVLPNNFYKTVATAGSPAWAYWIEWY